MATRHTVCCVNVECVEKAVAKKGWSKAYFCSTVMGKPRGWISEWKRRNSDGDLAPKNLPSPEEAARMCAILQVTPDEILTEPEDIELVRALIDNQRYSGAPGENGQKNSSLLDGRELTEDQIRAIEKIKRMAPDELAKKMPALEAVLDM